MCQVNANSSVSLKIENKIGSFSGMIEAWLDPVKTFGIVCVEPNSDWFVPWEDHASCQDSSNWVWVFGGWNFVGDKENYLNDLYQYQDATNTWKKMKNNGQTPKPRRGHVMFCYYNYLVMFGGEGPDGKVLGDLWVYDVIKWEWDLVMDSGNIHGA